MPEHSDPDGSDFADFLRSRDEAEQKMLQEAYLGDSQTDAARVLQKALGSYPRVCPECEGFCCHHTILLRDHFMRYAHELARRVVDGTALYLQSRDFGVMQLPELISQTYESWSVLAILFSLAEPQEGFDQMLLAAIDVEDEEDEDG
jgi:hypothetical protein